MKKRGYIYLIGFVVFILAVGLACGGSVSTPAAPAPQQPVDSGNSQPRPTVAPQQPPDLPQQPSNTGNSSDFVVFTDKNDYYHIEIPSDWKQEQFSGDYGYVDTFTSPDGQAMIENIMHDEGSAFAQKYKGQYALYLLNTYYSSTGKEGDIRVSDDSIQKDGSERLVWTSRGGNKSGISYFEVRNGSTFLMLTVQYSNEAKDQYLDTLNYVIFTYAVP